MFLSDRWLTSPCLELFTDASNSGFGGYLGNKWFAHGWPESWKQFHITVKEFFPIVCALELWANRMCNQCIMFHSDNSAVVHIINKQTSKDKTLMLLVRRLVIQSLKYNILFKAEHVPGVTNQLSDWLSRQQIPQFLQAFPHKAPVQVEVPANSFIL